MRQLIDSGVYTVIAVKKSNLYCIGIIDDKNNLFFRIVFFFFVATQVQLLMCMREVKRVE